jgi:hypothetical protein
MTDDEKNDKTEEDLALGLQLLEVEGESMSVVDLDVANGPGSPAAFVAALAILLRDRSDA